MAQELQTATLGSPGFFGLNTQDSPINLEPTFATEADNCIIDKFGRLGARKGFSTLTTDRSELSPDAGATYNPITTIHEYRDDVDANADIIFVAGNGKILKENRSGLTSTFTDMVEDSSILAAAGTDPYTITADNWQIESFNGRCYFFQADHEPLIYDNSDPGTVELKRITDHGSAVGVAPEGNAMMAAYGRIWATSVTEDSAVVFWSDLYNGTAWSGGSSGSIDITSVWPKGFDKITAIQAHNDFLIIFGRNNIIIYQGATSPSTMTLADTIVGIGCIARDSVQVVGSDVFFLSSTGIRSIGRTIQEKSSPLGDITSNVRTDLLADIESLVQFNGDINSVYGPEEAFYLLNLRYTTGAGEINKTYCVDMRQPLEDGSRKITTWTDSPFTSFHRSDLGVLYVGSRLGLGTYAGYLDNTETYTVKYKSPVLTFGEIVRQKIVKKIRTTIIAGANQPMTIKWSYGFSDLFYSEDLIVVIPNGAEWGEAEFATGQYAGGASISNQTVNTTGYGPGVIIGVEAPVNDNQFSIQEINVMTLIGRVI